MMPNQVPEPLPLEMGLGPKAKRERVVVACGVDEANMEVAAPF